MKKGIKNLVCFAAVLSVICILNFSIQSNAAPDNQYKNAASSSSTPSSSAASSLPPPSSTPSSKNPSTPASSKPASSSVPSSSSKPASGSVPPSSSSRAQSSSSNVQSYASSSQNTSSSEASASSSEASSSSSESSSSLSLPVVSEDDISLPYVLASSDNSGNNNMLFGIIAWACIILGVAIVIIVLLSNRKAHKGYVARKRYNNGFKRKKKNLLPDKYYRNIKRK